MHSWNNCDKEKESLNKTVDGQQPNQYLEKKGITTSHLIAINTKQIMIYYVGTKVSICRLWYCNSNMVL